MKLVSLLFKHVVGNQASIAAYPILLPAPRGIATVCWNEFYMDIIWETKFKMTSQVWSCNQVIYDTFNNVAWLMKLFNCVLYYIFRAGMPSRI